MGIILGQNQTKITKTKTTQQRQPSDYTILILGRKSRLPVIQDAHLYALRPKLDQDKELAELFLSRLQNFLAAKKDYLSLCWILLYWEIDILTKRMGKIPQ